MDAEKDEHVPRLNIYGDCLLYESRFGESVIYTPFDVCRVKHIQYMLSDPLA